MLLNLSHHPSEGWTDAQRAAAHAQFGTVEDVAFPVVDPAWDAGEVAALAEEYAACCLEKLRSHAGGAPAVHVMGEMTFTCALVERLHARGVRCVASTTERRSFPQEDGSRQVTFRFVRFRAYPRVAFDASSTSAP